MEIKISNMSGKLLGIRAINCNTLSNEFCKKQNKAELLNSTNICTLCYSFYMLQTHRKNCVDPWENNSQILSTIDLEKLKIIPTFKNDRIFRLDGHGELINMLHLHNYCTIAKHNEYTNIALWTKRKDLVNKYFKDHDKPKNLILIFSNSIINKPIYDIPKNFDKVFNNVWENDFLDEQNCTGQKCIDCQACYHFNDTNIIIEATKKYTKRKGN